MGVGGLILILFIHFVADFIIQTNWVAVNKSKKDSVLLLHVCLYGILFLVFGWKFAVFNTFLHFFTDYFTSRLTSYLWIKEERHLFFIVIGFDQFIHVTCLILTGQLLGVLNLK